MKYIRQLLLTSLLMALAACNAHPVKPASSKKAPHMLAIPAAIIAIAAPVAS